MAMSKGEELTAHHLRILIGEVRANDREGMLEVADAAEIFLNRPPEEEEED